MSEAIRVLLPRARCEHPARGNPRTGPHTAPDTACARGKCYTSVVESSFDLGNLSLRRGRQVGRSI